jgi:hypothetical protein
MRPPAWWSAVVHVAAPGLLLRQSPPHHSGFPRGILIPLGGHVRPDGDRGIAIIWGSPKLSGFVFTRRSASPGWSNHLATVCLHLCMAVQ